jgi:hypothetical protein
MSNKNERISFGQNETGKLLNINYSYIEDPKKSPIQGNYRPNGRHPLNPMLKWRVTLYTGCKSWDFWVISKHDITLKLYDNQGNFIEERKIKKKILVKISHFQEQPNNVI